jgi:endonuclease/exonuclease/phosphatase family metal-dependent hydrolase
VSANLRVITLNLWGTEPPLEARLALAVRQLAALAPDVVCLQEVRPIEGARTTAHAIADGLGMTATYETSARWKDGEYGALPAGEQGLAIIARTLRDRRVLALPGSRKADERILLSAAVETAGGPIWVHTTHLNYKLDDGIAREHQVLAIDDALRAGRTNDSAPQILCGDFNATPESDEIRFLRGLTTLGGRRTHFQDAWLRLHREPGPGDGPAEGLTWSSQNRFTRPLRSLDLDRRIDFIFVTTRKRDGRGTVHDCRVVLTEREGLGEVEICASDHYAVCADIQVVAT